MADWNSSMQQSFEFYVVDPSTWMDMKPLNKIIKKCTIVRDSNDSSLGYATIDCTENIGECYIRVYLITIQNGVREKHVLGTFLIQTPSISFNGKTQEISMDAYTPLIELKEKMPPIGYSVLKGDNIMELAYRICRENMRAPVIKSSCKTEIFDDFVAEQDDTWLSFLTDFISNAKFDFSLNEMGHVLFAPRQDISALQPIKTFDDGNSSILYPDVTMDRDLYGIPNAVEVVYSKDNIYYYSKVVNDDINSPISTVNRGREIIHRVSNPDFGGSPNQYLMDEYAEQLLRSLSSLEYTITYSHGYCPVRVGDCVRLDYHRAGLTNIKAKVVRQTIKCEPGCPVEEKAIFTAKMWR